MNKIVSRKKSSFKKRRYTHRTPLLRRKTHHSRVEGLIPIPLSPETQISLGLVVGKNITEKDPWIFIKREWILDHIDIYDTDSELNPIKELIQAYPEENILVGYFVKNEVVTNFFCTNIEAKLKILNHIAEEAKETEIILRRELRKTIGPWGTYGSEDEVDDSLIRNFRPLYEVWIKTKIPLTDQKVKFRLRRVEDVKDGYAEILTQRQTFENVFRKRVDGSSQKPDCTKISVGIQMTEANKEHKWTQNCYEYNEMTLTKSQTKNITNFMVEQMDSVRDAMNLNSHINLYADDYFNLPNQRHKINVFVPNDIMQFREPLACKDHKISALTWHPMISGIIAVAYTKYPHSGYVTRKENYDEIQETLFTNNLVLIWSYRNAVLPKLYLHSHRIISCLSFCPHNKNILLGGCRNGQVIIWDLTKKLDKRKEKEILTEKEQNNRSIMHDMTTWFKKTESDRDIKPTVISSIDHGHMDKVTSITWINSEYEFSGNGRFKKLDDTDPKSMQFISSSFDGNIYFWDIKVETYYRYYFEDNKQAKNLNERPYNHMEDISPLRKYHNKLRPFFSLIVRSNLPKVGELITHLIVPNQKYSYEAVNPDTMNDTIKKTYFKAGKLDEYSFLSYRMYVSTSAGNCLAITWSGYQEAQIFPIYKEVVECEKSMKIHDGPIMSFDENPFEPDESLTVGGRVFAVWDGKDIYKPAFWRKGAIRYVSGVWSMAIYSQAVLARADSYIEIWNFQQNYKSPINLIRCSLNPISRMFFEGTKYHTRKQTLIISDSFGAARVYSTPDEVDIMSGVKDQKLVAVALRARLDFKKKCLKSFLIQWKEKHGEQNQQEPEENKIEENKKEENKENLIENEEVEFKDLPRKVANKIKFQKKKALFLSKMENLAFKTLLEKQGITLLEYNEKQKAIKKVFAERQASKTNVKANIDKEDKVFQSEMEDILDFGKFINRPPIKVNILDDVQVLKQSYLDSYKTVEDAALDTVNRKKFIFNFNWQNMIAGGRSRLSLVNIKTYGNIEVRPSGASMCYESIMGQLRRETTELAKSVDALKREY